MNTRKILITVVALAATTALAACGGSATSGSQQDIHKPTTPPAPTQQAATGPTHDAFIAALNAYCTEGNAKIDRLQSKLNAAVKANDATAAADLWEQAKDVLPASEAPSGAPAEDKAAYGRYLDALRQQEGLMARLATAVRAEDVDSIDTLGGLMDGATKQRIKAAISLGADKCGKP
jgi:hypothetical protein